MNMLATARCRLVQACLRLGRRMHPAGKQTLETGAGAVSAVGQLLRDKKLRKPLVAPGAGEDLARFMLLRALDEAGVRYHVWDGMAAVPTPEDAEQLCQVWRGEGCDCFLALGDRAVLDAVKAAAALTTARGRRVRDLAAGRVAGKLPPVIAVPTVGGAGAEALASATVTAEDGRLFTLTGPALLPAVAILDPELLAEAPRDKVADAGLDGLCRAIEAFLASRSGDSTVRGWAAEAVELFLQDLESCWNTGGSVKERMEILNASRLAGRVSGAVGGGYVRALVRALQAVCGIPFREACGALLPIVLEKYGIYAEEKLSLLAAMADLQSGGSRRDRVAALIGRLRTLVFRMGLPDALTGITADQVRLVGDRAAAEANPRSVSPVVWTAEECRAVVLSACARPEE